MTTSALNSFQQAIQQLPDGGVGATVTLPAQSFTGALAAAGPKPSFLKRYGLIIAIVVGAIALIVYFVVFRKKKPAVATQDTKSLIADLQSLRPMRAVASVPAPSAVPFPAPSAPVPVPAPTTQTQNNPLADPNFTPL